MANVESNRDEIPPSFIARTWRNAKAFFAIVTKALVIPLLLFAAATYLIDIGSDVFLAGGYFYNGDTWWGGLTTTFVAIPWMLYLAYVIMLVIDDGVIDFETVLFILCGIFNVVPLFYLFLAAKEHLSGDEDAKETKSSAIFLRLVEVVAEAFPQASLQLYIAAQSNNFNTLLIISVISSIFSVISGMMKGVFCAAELANKGMEVNFGVTFVAFPWLLLHFISFVPPLAFFSSLKTHVAPAILMAVLYFPIHTFLSALFTFIYPFNGMRNVAYIEHSIEPRYRPLFRFLSLPLQICFTIASIWIATSWIVSLAPFLDPSSVELLPSFIWPNTTTAFRKWIVEADVGTFNQSWAICNVSSSSLNQSLIPPTNATDSTASSSSFCLTDMAAHLYLFFVVVTLVLFIYHVSLIIFWPRIWSMTKN